jgi:hypothetical protein
MKAIRRSERSEPRRGGVWGGGLAPFEEGPRTKIGHLHIQEAACLGPVDWCSSMIICGISI